MPTEVRVADGVGASPPDPGAPGPARVASIDALRGLTILVMIFVNDVSGVAGIPWWMKHMPPGADGMTFVDVVLPAFLFIVGLAIPFALSSRLERGQSLRRIAGHVVVRTLGLLTLGLFMVNMPPDAAATGMNSRLWMLLVLLCAIPVWNAYPPAAGARRAAFLALRVLGIAGLVALAAIYRRSDAGHVTWMRPQWWGILGMIGWAYLVGCAVYLVFRRHLEAMVGMIGVLLLAYVAGDKGVFEPLGPIARWLWIGGVLGSQGAITVAGAAIGALFFPGSPATTPAARVRWIVVYALVLFTVGWWLSPLYGTSKIEATPSWCMFSAAICSALFALLYLIMDVWKRTRWAAFLRPAAENPLLAYFLPIIFYSALAVWPNDLWPNNPLATPTAVGITGVLRSVVFAFVMVWVTGLLGKARIRLRF